MANSAKRVVKGGQPLANSRRRINVKRRSVALCQLGERNIFAVQDEILTTLAKNEPRRTLGVDLERPRKLVAPHHFRLECPTLSLTLIATTV